MVSTYPTWHLSISNYLQFVSKYETQPNYQTTNLRPSDY